MSKQQALPHVDIVEETVPAPTPVDLAASWNRIRRSCEDVVLVVGHGHVVVDLDLRGSQLTEALRDANGSHLYGLHVSYLNIASPNDEIAEEFAAQRGKVLTTPGQAELLEEFQRDAGEEFGPALAKFTARWNAQRGLRVAVNIPKISKRPTRK